MIFAGILAISDKITDVRDFFFNTPGAEQVLVPVTGKDLVERLASCKQDGNTCHSYILAVATGSLATTRLLTTGDLFCLPETIRDADILAAVEIFLEANPGALTWPSPIIVIGALQARFPCPPSHHPNR